MTGRVLLEVENEKKRDYYSLGFESSSNILLVSPSISFSPIILIAFETFPVRVFLSLLFFFSKPQSNVMLGVVCNYFGYRQCLGHNFLAIDMWGQQ